jgi:hypothetical protein
MLKPGKLLEAQAWRAAGMHWPAGMHDHLSQVCCMLERIHVEDEEQW